jgi:hypothetical protein
MQLRRSEPDDRSERDDLGLSASRIYSGSFLTSGWHRLCNQSFIRGASGLHLRRSECGRFITQLCRPVAFGVTNICLYRTGAEHRQSIREFRVEPSDNHRYVDIE